MLIETLVTHPRTSPEVLAHLATTPGYWHDRALAAVRINDLDTLSQLAGKLSDLTAHLTRPELTNEARDILLDASIGNHAWLTAARHADTDVLVHLVDTRAHRTGEHLSADSAAAIALNPNAPETLVRQAVEALLTGPSATALTLTALDMHGLTIDLDDLPQSTYRSWHLEILIEYINHGRSLPNMLSFGTGIHPDEYYAAAKCASNPAVIDAILSRQPTTGTLKAILDNMRLPATSHHATLQAALADPTEHYPALQLAAAQPTMWDSIPDRLLYAFLATNPTRTQLCRLATHNLTNAHTATVLDALSRSLKDELAVSPFAALACTNIGTRPGVDVDVRTQALVEAELYISRSWTGLTAREMRLMRGIINAGITGLDNPLTGDQLPAAAVDGVDSQLDVTTQARRLLNGTLDAHPELLTSPDLITAVSALLPSFAGTLGELIDTAASIAA